MIKIVNKQNSFTSNKFILKNILQRALMSSSSTPPSNQSIQGPAITSIKNKIKARFPNATHFAIFNDSYLHKGHGGIMNSRSTSESHVRIELVTDDFEGMKLPMRHRIIYKLIQDEMQRYNIHAVQLKTKTVKEMAKVSLPSSL
ncbi:Bol1p PWA37_002209 [Arxiozyma heterogenica]|uniref:Bol1p n=1 Tax=Arxiozyma heterogenica TaxID=278026 RepID=UPI002EDE1C06